LTLIVVALIPDLFRLQPVTAAVKPALLASPAISQPNQPGQLLRRQAETECTSLIQNGNFEDDALMSLWSYSSITEQVTRTSVPHYVGPNQSFSMLLPDTDVAGTPRQPWLYQSFVMPLTALTQTLSISANLTLTLHVGVNPQGSPEPDPFFVSLLDEAGNPLLATGSITVATGADLPTLNPSSFTNDDWIFKTIVLSEVYNPAAYAGQTLRLYFEAPNSGTASTIFYLDNVDLVFCTTLHRTFLPGIRNDLPDSAPDLQRLPGQP
jgi:hypothetical protein